MKVKPSVDMQKRIDNLIEATIESSLVLDIDVRLKGKLVVFFSPPVITSICQNFLLAITCSINLTIEFLSGHINSNQCLDCFEWENEIVEYGEEIKMLFSDEAKFVLKFNSQYRIQTELECLQFKVDENKASLDFYLLKLFDLKEFDEKIDPFVITQLKSLKRIYKIKKSDENCFIIKSKLNVDLETIKSRLQRLFNIEPKLKEFLCNHKKTMPLKSDKIKSHGHFVSRFYELKHLDEYLKERGAGPAPHAPPAILTEVNKYFTLLFQFGLLIYLSHNEVVH